MERLAIWTGILILLFHLSCLESRSDLGGHSEVRQNVDGKDNRPFVRHARGISDFHGSGVGWRSNEDAARTKPQHDSGNDFGGDENHENELTAPLPEPGKKFRIAFFGVPRGGLSGPKLGGRRMAHTTNKG
ncbi:hypothetical protein BV898_12274 [Hypsibius exemplaris]|uniref:Uncharacterized protein n=1 Tax=Hypsibius exemplaris TaxID=2072580 RepID=A0A1W0WEB4_HYPEX|nr:hypothetical protein BV898_12274 [Hypsibius exemplaris]